MAAASLGGGGRDGRLSCAGGPGARLERRGPLRGTGRALRARHRARAPAVAGRLRAPRDGDAPAAVPGRRSRTSGLADALVQKRELAERHRLGGVLDGLVTGVGLTAATVILAPQIAGFYEVPELATLARALAPLFLPGALERCRARSSSARLDFRRVSCRSQCAAAAVAGAAAVAARVGAGSASRSLVVRPLLRRRIGRRALLRGERAGGVLDGVVGGRPRRPRRSSVQIAITRTFGYWSRHVDELLVWQAPRRHRDWPLHARIQPDQVPIVYVSRAAARRLLPSSPVDQDDLVRVRHAPPDDSRGRSRRPVPCAAASRRWPSQWCSGLSVRSGAP